MKPLNITWVPALNGIWHIHTNYTHGKNSVSDYCRFAKKMGVELICFAEHVSKNLSYDFDSYLLDVQRARERYGIKVLGGVEVKIMDDGLDAGEDVLRKADVVFGAIHREISSNVEYLATVEQLLSTRIHIWAHPTWYFNANLTKKEVDKIVGLLKKSNVIVELNLRCNVPKAYFLSKCFSEKVPILIGVDAHSLDELKELW